MPRSSAAESRHSDDARTSFERFVEAAQEKLNVIAEALSDLMESRAREDEELTDAIRRLRESVGLEERH